MTKESKEFSKEDLEKLSDEQLKEIENKVGSQLRDMFNKTVEQSNKLLSQYGLQVKLQFLIEERKS